MAKWASAGSYAKTMRLRAVPFKRRRPNMLYKRPGPPGAQRLIGRGRMQLRQRGRGGLTKTQTKTKRPGTVSRQGDNSSISANRIGKSYLSRALYQLTRKIINPQRVHVNTSGASSSGMGRQQTFTQLVMTKTQLDDIATAANAGTATNNTVRAFLKSAKMRLHFKNQANSNARVAIYDIVTWKNPCSTAVDTPVEAWNKGLVDLGVTSGERIIGQVPQRSPEFNAFYKVNRVTYVNLEPGQQHEHNVYYNYNRILNSVNWQNAVSTCIPGLTRMVMVVFHGSLIHESATPTTVTYTDVTLDYASSIEYQYGFLERTTPSMTVSNNFATTLVDGDMMGESGDADLNAINA